MKTLCDSFPPDSAHHPGVRDESRTVIDVVVLSSDTANGFVSISGQAQSGGRKRSSGLRTAFWWPNHICESNRGIFTFPGQAESN